MILSIWDDEANHTVHLNKSHKKAVSRTHDFRVKSYFQVVDIKIGGSRVVTHGFTSGFVTARKAPSMNCKKQVARQLVPFPSSLLIVRVPPAVP
jgi:hypothetical protein